MGKIDRSALTVNGRTLYENNEGRFSSDREVIRAHEEPLKARAGFLNLEDLRERDHEDVGDLGRVSPALSLEPGRPGRVRRPGVVFDGPEDYGTRQIDNPELALDEKPVLVIRGVGPSATPARPKWSTCPAGVSLEARHPRAAVHRRRRQSGTRQARRS